MSYEEWRQTTMRPCGPGCAPFLCSLTFPCSLLIAKLSDFGDAVNSSGAGHFWKAAQTKPEAQLATSQFPALKVCAI